MNLANITRGDTKYYTFRMRNKATGQLLNLDGGTLFFTVKKNTNDADADALIAKAVATSGTEATIYLSHLDTNVPPTTYQADFQWVGAGGTPVKTYKSPLIIEKDVTQRITV